MVQIPLCLDVQQETEIRMSLCSNGGLSTFKVSTNHGVITYIFISIFQ